ncbi:endospore germination permease [Tumebacillus sp. ITR2]|uniref:Endospore germination permease n=1 Tax=Tumebacillus amylolyticus TaxID=2801339 RepID=A0ABS1JGS9_9BACL|nr:endospore germination permease [Tumebacillus amylolyticus]
MSRSVERISSSEIFSLLVMFCIGSTLILPKGSIAGHDSWLSVLFAIPVGLLVAQLYAALSQSHPGLSLVEIGQQAFGVWVGRFLGLLYVWYSFHLGTIALKSMEEITRTVLLPQTPALVIDMGMMLLCVWVVKEGIEVLSRCSIMILGAVILFLLGSLLLLGKDMDINNLKPVADVGWKKITEGTTKISIFPFGESVLLLMIYPFLNQKRESKKTAFWAILTAGVLLLVDDLRNILVFGDLMKNIQYPSYSAISYISISDFLERIETFGILVWVFGSFVKVSACLYVSALALAQTIGSRDVGKAYRFLTIPLAILLVEMTQFLYRSHAELTHFATKVWPWYSVPFCVLIPFLLYVVLKIKQRTKKAHHSAE